MEIARKFEWRLLLVSTRLIGYYLAELATFLLRDFKSVTPLEE